jgi:hypothetical protein
VHSSRTVSARNRMRRPGDGAAWKQTPRRAWGSLCQVEETVDVVTPLPVRVWRSRLSRGVAEQLRGCHEGPARCGHRLGH